MSFMRSSVSDVNEMTKVTNPLSIISFQSLACKNICHIFKEKNDCSYREAVCLDGNENKIWSPESLVGVLHAPLCSCVTRQVTAPAYTEIPPPEMTIILIYKAVRIIQIVTCKALQTISDT